MSAVNVVSVQRPPALAPLQFIKACWFDGAIGLVILPFILIWVVLFPPLGIFGVAMWGAYFVRKFKKMQSVDVGCPLCDRSLLVYRRAENMKCPRCSNRIGIRWN